MPRATKYDENNSLESYTAYNLITSGISICGGYSDIMAIYLNKLGIKNYKITSENHIWNLLELDGVWYHLDATWDDPVASDGNQYLIHNFFMISTEELLKPILLKDFRSNFFNFHSLIFQVDHKLLIVKTALNGIVHAAR